MKAIKKENEIMFYRIHVRFSFKFRHAGISLKSSNFFLMGYDFRILVLSAGAFDSKTRFLQELRKKFGGGTFNLGGATVVSNLANFYSSLKADAMKGGHQ